ncbi:MAG: hypothetical protein IT562_14890 [Alphaproteobacteria bacterium]|nr:hypothetical protein [Alphaproteobacteria bacterium]
MNRAAGLALGFVAGFLAVLLFHQPVVGLLQAVGLGGNAPYNMQPIPPLGVPRVVSLAFWGGVWGIVFALLRPWLPARGWAFVLAGLVFGAIAPTLFGRFVLTPLRGQAIQALTFANLWRGLVVNGAWGLGTAIVLVVAGRGARRR